MFFFLKRSYFKENILKNLLIKNVTEGGNIENIQVFVHTLTISYDLL